MHTDWTEFGPGFFANGQQAEPMGRIHFAGEQCSSNFQGFMEGGAEEGQRAANEILALLG
jgi:monoamine oxidase